MSGDAFSRELGLRPPSPEDERAREISFELFRLDEDDEELFTDDEVEYLGALGIPSPAGQPSGFHIERPDGGYDRPANTVENEDEVRFAYLITASPTLTCAYCGDFNRTRNEDAAALWFRSHDCPPLEASEQAGVLYDLGVLPDGSPFAPPPPELRTLGVAYGRR